MRRMKVRCLGRVRIAGKHFIGRADEGAPFDSASIKIRLQTFFSSMPECFSNTISGVNDL